MEKSSIIGGWFFWGESIHNCIYNIIYQGDWTFFVTFYHEAHFHLAHQYLKHEDLEHQD